MHKAKRKSQVTTYPCLLKLCPRLPAQPNYWILMYWMRPLKLNIAFLQHSSTEMLLMVTQYQRVEETNATASFSYQDGPVLHSLSHHFESDSFGLQRPYLRSGRTLGQIWKALLFLAFRVITLRGPSAGCTYTVWAIQKQCN